VEFVIEEAEGDQSIHIEQVDHGKFAKISSTSLLLKVGACALPDRRTVLLFLTFGTSTASA